MNTPENTPETPVVELSPKELKRAESKIKRDLYMKNYLANYRKTYYETNREVLLEKQKIWNAEHVEKVRVNKQNWYRKHKVQGALMQSTD
jgi:hypothetical protein